MKLTVKQVFEIQDSGALERLAQKELPLSISFSIARMLRSIRQEFRDANDQRVRLFTTENSTAIEGTPMLQLKPGCEKKYLEDLAPLLLQVVTVQTDPLDLGGLTISISPADLVTLEPIIVLPRPKSPPAKRSNRQARA